MTPGRHRALRRSARRAAIDRLSRLLTAHLAGVAGSRSVSLRRAACRVAGSRCVGLSVLAGVAQIYFALRVGFDAALFAAWRMRPHRRLDLAGFDAAMRPAA